MSLIRRGRTVLFLLPYVLILSGVLVAGKAVGSPGGTPVVLQALVVVSIGVAWSYVRARRS
ncbi:hypothetical protein ACWGIB_23655 [Streptomyces xiamenensis]